MQRGLGKYIEGYLALACVLLLAAALRFYHLRHESLWLDEVISYQRSNMPVRELIAEAISAFHNPTYFLILRGFLTFGDSEFFLRLPSALFGLMKVFVVYQVGRTACGRTQGVLAALVVAVGQSQIHYDQEARMYAPQLFAIALALLGLVSVLDNAPGSRTTVGRKGAWLLYVLGSTLALYLHNTSVLFLAACWIAVGAIASLDRTFGKAIFKWWTTAHAAIVALYLPYASTLFSQTDALSEKGYGRSIPRLEQVLEILRELYLLGQSSVVVALLVVAFACTGVWSLRRQPKLLTLLAILSIAGPVFLGMVSLWEPMFLVRLMLWSALPFAVLVGAGMAQLKNKPALILVAVAFATLQVKDLHVDYYTVWQKPNWRGAIRYLADHQSEGDIVLAIGEREERFLNYYWGRRNHPLPRFAVTWDLPEMQRNLESIIAHRTTVWTLRGRTFEGGTEIRRELRTTRRRVLEREFGPRLVVERYESR